MKIAAYNYRDFDEAAFFEKFGKQYGVEILPIRETPSVENAHLAAGCEGVSVITTPITGDIMRAWREQGVKHVSTRTIGYDHIDLDAARRLDMKVSNVTYSTGSVADYAVMLILMALRRMKSIIKRAEGMDYSLNGNIGREIGSLTVGVVGTGKIGTHVRVIFRDLDAAFWPVTHMKMKRQRSMHRTVHLMSCLRKVMSLLSTLQRQRAATIW